MEKIISKYLKHLKIPISVPYVEKLIQSHPDYPSILSVADVLMRLGVKHIVARFNRESLSQIVFPYILVLEAGGGEGELVIVQNEKELSEENLDQWKGIVLKVEKAEGINDTENQKQLSNERFLNITKAVLLSAIMVLLANSFIQSFSWVYSGLIITALIGMVTGYLHIAKDIGIKYKAVESFCSTGKNSVCDKILKSDGTKFLGRFTFSEALMSYFTFQIIVIGLIVPFLENSAESMLFSLSIFNVLTLPVVLYSLYYQQFVAKTWCRLCLIVDGILIGQLIVYASIMYYSLIPIQGINLMHAVVSGFLFLAILSLTILFKNNIEMTTKSRQAEVAGNRIRYSPELFTKVLLQERKVDSTPFKEEFLIGKPDAPIKIMMAANIFCSPCKTNTEG